MNIHIKKPTLRTHNRYLTADYNLEIGSFCEPLKNSPSIMRDSIEEPLGLNDLPENGEKLKVCLENESTFEKLMR